MTSRTSQQLLILLTLLTLLFACKTVSPEKLLKESPAEKDQRMAWWREARFGLFIHWGLYAIPAGEWNGKTEYGEWIRHTAEIPLKTYDEFLPRFNPVRFNADEWVKMAKDAGMKYIVITTKHHDGFAIFDSKYSDFDVMTTPFGRDIIRELADACQREGIRLCFYHSIMDWHHPDYLPRRPWETDRSPEGADYDRYVQYMKNQLTELCKNYGDAPHVLWFDGEWEGTWTEARGLDLYKFVRALKPGIIINNRVGASREGMAGMTKNGGFAADFGTPEQEIPTTGIPGVDWESCMTMNRNWGYNKADKDYKSTRELIQNLVDIASKGGNFLLNVGPTEQGIFPRESVERLREIANWMKVNAASIHGTVASPLASQPWGRITMKTEAGNTILYLHLFQVPKNGLLLLNGVGNTPVRASLLAAPNQDLPLPVRQEDALVLELPEGTLQDPFDNVVRLELAEAGQFYIAPKVIARSDLFVGQTYLAFEQAAPGQTIRYRLDGRAPDAQSPVYDKPVLLTESAQIAARLFMADKPLSAVSRYRMSKTEPQPASGQAALAPGLEYYYYEGIWEKLPDFDTLKALEKGRVGNFERPRKGKDGEWYAYEYRGFLEIPEDGLYTLYIASDDGSKLWINQKLVADNDRQHGNKEVSASLALGKGRHELLVHFFQATGSEELKISWESDSIAKQPLPASALWHVPQK
jgi:alpha-L-fucosidase